MYKGTIVHITKSIGPTSYGVGQVALNLSKAQDEAGLSPELWILDEMAVAVNAARDSNVRTRILRPFTPSRPRILGYSRDMEQAARDIKISGGIVVHQHMIWLLQSRTARILAKKKGARVVIAPHGALDDWGLKKSQLKKWIARRIYEDANLRSCDCLQATSEREISNFRNFGLVNPIARINNGVTTEQLTAVGDGEKFRQQFSIGADRRIMLFVSRISPQKGLIMMLNAMAELLARLGSWLLVIAGSNQNCHEEEVLAETKKLGLLEHVAFVGPLFGSAKLDAFAASDVFVLPSHSEGAPMIVLEAMAAGLPVITTKAAPWPQLVSHRCGWWCDISKKALQQVLEDACGKKKAEMAHMGARAHELVAKEYSWSGAAQQTSDLYCWLRGEGEQPDFVIKK